jgi:hypothetical protein
MFGVFVLFGRICQSFAIAGYVYSQVMRYEGLVGEKGGWPIVTCVNAYRSCF